MPHSIYDIRPGDIVAVTDHMGNEDVITVTRAQEYDGVMTVTDQTGWDTPLDKGDPFRYIHRAHR